MGLFPAVILNTPFSFFANTQTFSISLSAMFLFWLLIFSSKFILLKVKDKNALSYAQV